MSKGREVADAYIDVHGDLKSFRNSLDKAAVSGRKAGREAADSFAEAWSARSEREFGKRWDGVLDAAYSNKKVDWNRLIPLFDASNFEDASKKIQKFMQDNLAAKKLDRDQYDYVVKAMRGQLKMLEEEERKVRDLAETKEKERKKRLADEQALQWQMAENHRAQERYNKSYANLFRITGSGRLENDFRRIAQAMETADWSKWTKGAEDMDQIGERVRTVVREMTDLGRVTDEQGKRIVASVDDHIRAEKSRAEAISRSRLESERFKNSLDNLVENAGLRNMERDFKRITEAMATTNWGPISKDFTNLRDFRDHVDGVADSMRRAGRISDSEFERIGGAVRRATRHVGSFNVELSKGENNTSVMNRMTNMLRRSWGRMDSTVKLVMVAILAAAGPLATMLSGIGASLTAVVSSVGMAAATFVPLVAAAGAFAAGIFLAVSSFDEVSARLPRIQQSLDSIAATWAQQAKNFGDAWGDSFDELLNSFATRFGEFDIGTPLGTAFAEITNAFNAVVNGPAFTAFMTAMTGDLPAAVSGLGRGFAGLFEGLMSLMAGAAPVAKALGQDFANWGAAIASSLESARESGKLNEVFEKARESLLSVLDLTGSIGSALGTMFMIGADTGNSLLDSLTRIVDKFNEWMKTDAGRASMLEWFENGARIVRSFEPLVVGLGQALDKLVTPHSIASVENLMEGLGKLLPTLGGLLSAISDLNVLNILVDLLNLVGELVEPLLPAFSELAKIIGGVLQDALAEMSPLFSTVGEALVPVMELLAELAAEILPPLVPLIGAIIDVAVKLIPVIAEMLKFAVGILGFVGDIAKAILEMDGLITIVEGFGRAMGGALDLIIGLLTGDWERAWGGAGNIVGGFGDVFRGLWEIVSEVMGWIGNAWTTFQQITEHVFGGLGDWFGEIWGGIRSGAEDFGNGFTSFFSDTWGNIKTGAEDTWNNIRGSVEEAWGGMKETVGGFLSEMGGNINEKLDGFWTKFDEVFPGTRALAEEEWGKLRDKVGEIAGHMGERVSEGWNSMATTVGTKAAEIATTASGKWEEIKTDTSEKWGVISSYVGSKWDEMTGKVGEVANDIGGKVKTKWDEISSDTSEKWGTISTFLGTKWDEMTNKTRGATEEIGRRAGEGGGWVRDRIMGPVTEMKTRWDNTWNNISSAFGRVWEQLKNGALNGVNAIMQWMIQLPGKILNTLISLPGQMYTAGRNMLQGMINGVVSIASNMVNAAVNAARNAVQAVKNFLGIRSPSRVFMGIGEYMGEGMVIGIDSTASMVQKAAVGLADAAVGEFAGDRMFTAGQDAAVKLAEGLAANKDILANALGPIEPNLGEFASRAGRPASESGDGTGTAGSKVIQISEGAINLSTQSKDPLHSAEMLLESIATSSNL